MTVRPEIDYVVPYVDGTDPEWAQLYMKNRGLNENAENLLEVRRRFSPNVLFRYQFRGIAKFMPWIRSVHLIVQSESQIPKWIDRSAVHVVKHEDYMPAEFLPTYNSSSMECFLHRIPGLSELFIYSNDDFYVTAVCEPSDFFDGVMPYSSAHLRRVSPVLNESYARMNMNITKFICSELGLEYVPWSFFIQDHVQRAMNRTIYRMIYEKYENYIKSKCTMFRTDDNLSQAFFTMYYIKSVGGRWKKHLPYRRFDVFQEFDQIIRFFDETPPDAFPKLLCINNNDNEKDVALLCRFEKMFPGKCKYEL